MSSNPLTISFVFSGQRGFVTVITVSLKTTDWNISWQPLISKKEVFMRSVMTAQNDRKWIHQSNLPMLHQGVRGLGRDSFARVHIQVKLLSSPQFHILWFHIASVSLSPAKAIMVTLLSLPYFPSLFLTPFKIKPMILAESRISLTSQSHIG